MADIIPGRQTINVGVQNQATGSDDLYTAFTKVETNFENLFTNASPYLNIKGSTGISVSNPSSNTVTITNSGVIGIAPGTGITLDNNKGVVTISVSGSVSGIVAGVTNVGIRSTTLNISGSPIISKGVIAIELPAISTSEKFNPGVYISPTLTVDQYGRIVEISNISTAGTVTSVAVTAGDGIRITGSPVIDSGTISVTNTGVTRLTAGPGISLSGSTGAITISGINPSAGTVSRIDVASQTLTVTGSPITTSGTISIELPSTPVFDKVTGANVVSTGPMSAIGNFSAGNISTTGNLTVGNITTTNGIFWANGAPYSPPAPNILMTNITANIAIATTNQVSLPLDGLSYSGNILIFNNVAVDTESAYSTSTGRYTPTVAGYYRFDASFSPTIVSLGTNSSAVQDGTNYLIMLIKNGSTIMAVGQQIGGMNLGAGGFAWSGFTQSSLDTIVRMNGTTDYVQVLLVATIKSGSFTNGNTMSNYFQALWLRA